MNINKQTLQGFLIPIFYTAVIVLMFFAAQTHEKKVQYSTPLYIDLTESPTYIRRGFSQTCLRPENFDQLAEELRLETAEGGHWARFLSPPPLLVMDSPLADLPQRRFLSPKGSEAEEFTILIPVEINTEAISYLKKQEDVIPGIFLAGIGDNWQIYFNGTLVISHMFQAFNVSFPVDRSLIIPGINILALRITGDPTCGNTGLFYGSPYYMNDYRVIEKQNNNFILLVLCGVFLLSGAYYLILFLSSRTKREIYFLLFSIFSFLLFVFTITRHSVINLYIPNSGISGQIEFYSYMLAVIALGMFIETFGRGKITKVTWGYLIFVLYFILTIQFFPASQYRNDFALIANLTNIIYYFYIFIYNIAWFYFFDKRGPKGKNFDISVISVITGTLLIFISDIYEIVLYFTGFHNYNFFIYSVITLHIGLIFILAQRYINMEKEMQQNQVAIMLSQIQPHFLYNSLSVIRQLCKTNPKTAEETVLEFANYLRGNMDSLTQKELIPFERELQHVQVYLTLEKKRLGEMLNAVFEINYDKFKLPALVLQPIVENAVNYGITKNADGGTIKIKTDKVKENVIITVTDDGGGFNAAIETNDTRSHIGIENVKNRLKAMCCGSLEIQTENGVCTTISIIIPIIKGSL